MVNHTISRIHCIYTNLAAEILVLRNRKICTNLKEFVGKPLCFSEFRKTGNTDKLFGFTIDSEGYGVPKVIQNMDICTRFQSARIIGD